LQAQQLEGYLVKVEKLYASAQGNFTQAQQVIANESVKYAKKWSTGNVQALEAYKPYFAEGGLLAIIKQARAAQSDDKLGDPYKILGDAESKLNGVEAFAVQITGANGTTPYYSQLKGKSDGAGQYLASANGEIVAAKAYIDGLSQDSWNKSHKVSFQAGYNQLIAAQDKLDVANKTLTSRLVGDNVDYDLPLAYDQGSEVFTAAKLARQLADDESHVARDADAQITNAERVIGDADSYIRSSTYNTLNAMTSLDKARSSYNAAVDAFWGDPGADRLPNFQQARDFAFQAQNEARYAQGMAATPTPVPTDTPVPTARPSSSSSGGIGIIIINSGSGSSSSSSDDDCCYGSGSYGSGSSNFGSSDSGGSSYSSGSSSSNFDSNDDYGSSNFSSNDDYNSSSNFSSDDDY
jgi:hypothetical protein